MHREMLKIQDGVAIAEKLNCGGLYASVVQAAQLIVRAP